MISFRIVWLIAFLGLSLVIVPQIVYDETKTSSLTGVFGFANPFTGTSFGSVFFGAVSLEHDGIGIGLIIASLLIMFLRQGPGTHSILGIALFVIGVFLFISDLPSLNSILAGNGGDFVLNPMGMSTSIGLGLAYGISIFGMIAPTDTLGEVVIG